MLRLTLSARAGRFALVAIAIVAGVLVVTACDLRPPGRLQYGRAGAVPDGSGGMIWFAAAGRRGDAPLGVLRVADGRARIDSPRIDGALHGLFAPELFFVERDGFLWFAKRPSADAYAVARWDPTVGFTRGATGEVPAPHMQAVRWCCRISPLDEPAVYALGGRHRGAGPDVEPWWRFFDLGTDAATPQQSATVERRRREFAALFDTNDVYVGMTVVRGSPVHAFLGLDADGRTVSLHGLRNGVLDEIPVPPTLAAFARERNRERAFFVPLIADGDIPLVLAGVRDPDERLELTAHTDRPVPGRARLLWSSGIPYAATVDGQGHPVAVVSGSMTGLAHAVAVRSGGVEVFETFPEGWYDPLCASWGQHLALVHAGTDPEVLELISVRTGSTNYRARVWRHRLVLGGNAIAWPVETLDAYGRRKSPGPDQL